MTDYIISDLGIYIKDGELDLKNLIPVIEELTQKYISEKNVIFEVEENSWRTATVEDLFNESSADELYDLVYFYLEDSDQMDDKIDIEEFYSDYIARTQCFDYQ